MFTDIAFLFSSFIFKEHHFLLKRATLQKMFDSQEEELVLVMI